MHQPVLKKEVLDYLNPQPNENFIDCTFGFGGHTELVLKRNRPNGKVLGIERDKEVIEILRRKKLNERLVLVQGNFVDLNKITEENDFSSVNGILFDLGFSSWQIEKSGRGFSFLRDEPLDMRFEKDGVTAEEIINHWPEHKIEKILREYGEERYAKRIAKAICQQREIKRTFELVEIIKRVVPGKYHRGRRHFATRTFQALRIAVNNELNNLENALPQALEILEKKGRLVALSFHSLEDRIVKNFFREKKQEQQLEILTKKPIRPNQEEIRQNPRSRSAKLRAAIKK